MSLDGSVQRQARERRQSLRIGDAQPSKLIQEIVVAWQDGVVLGARARQQVSKRFAFER